MSRIENTCARHWKYLLVLSIVLMVGCALTSFQPDGTLVQSGQDIVPGVLPDGSADVVGAVVDAAQEQGTAIVSAATSGNWLGLIVAVLGFGSAVVGGVAARRAYRKRQAGKTILVPPVSMTRTAEEAAADGEVK
ncbi:MAG: hypothetical protein WC683_07260 [bacterium]